MFYETLKLVRVRSAVTTPTELFLRPASILIKPQMRIKAKSQHSEVNEDW